MLNSFHLLENRKHLLENILGTLDVIKYVDFENQTIEKTVFNHIRIEKTSFGNVTFGKLSLIM